MTSTAISRRGVSIRLTDERWAHITEEHCELAGLRLDVLESISMAEGVYEGGAGELLAMRELETGKWLVVVYREGGDDGFVITAFWARRIQAVTRRKRLWP